MILMPAITEEMPRHMQYGIGGEGAAEHANQTHSTGELIRCGLDNLRAQGSGWVAGKRRAGPALRRSGGR